MLYDGTFVPFRIFGGDARLLFKRDGTRHNFCKDVLPKPMTQKELKTLAERDAQFARALRARGRSFGSGSSRLVHTRFLPKEDFSEEVLGAFGSEGE
jgi:hypothetical protein